MLLIILFDLGFELTRFDFAFVRVVFILRDDCPTLEDIIQHLNSMLHMYMCVAGSKLHAISSILLSLMIAVWIL